MELKPGYKQTEVGVIPEDWDVKRIGDLGTIVRGGSPRPAGDSRYFNGKFIPWLTVGSLTNIPKSQLYVQTTNSMLTEAGMRHSRVLEPDTLIISNSGATLGVAKILSIRCCANDGVAAIIDQRKGDKVFLAQYINTKTKELHDNVATGNGQPNLNRELIGNILVPFPSENEQKLIGQALSDMDTLIQSLEQQIIKKQQIKQGAMQTLLNPYDEQGVIKSTWKALRLGDVASLKARIGWQGLTTAEYRKSGEYTLITGTEFFDGGISWESCFYVDFDRYKQDKNIQVKIGDILITKDGTIGKVAYVRTLPRPATLNSGVFVVRPTADEFCPEFLYHLLMSKLFKEFLAQLSAGSTINHLYQKDFVGFTFFTPRDIEQQKFIAASLSEMDSEIAEIRFKLDKQRKLKQGMMQNLLTGTVRLV
ncbi:restriction endonuclease subunit S [Endozoicomonas acroporae]|uniref:restriction endonuclease subunit S n=1 Tax=Endozoicomonas acroporae TaxID=1701104 RepID=UPI003D7A64A3